MLLLSKLLPLFLYPVGLTILLALGGLCLWLIGYWRTARAALVVGVAVLWLASTPVLANWLYSRLEAVNPPVAVDQLPSADVIIVLGGIVGQPIPPRLTSDVSDAFDRILETARLYRAGKARAVLVSGGNLPWTIGAAPEGQLIADLLVELGVAKDAVVVDSASQNTHENAVNSATVMRAMNWRTALLVTSAAHMPRALATFRKAGVSAIPAVADIEVTYPLVQSVLDLVPDAEALARTTQALKEYLGLWAYRLVGWA